MPRSELLTFEEITRIAKLLVNNHGFNSIRLTGGEPTVRAHLPRLVGQLAGLDADLSLTTNGATLRGSAADLAAAGLTRINISLDTLRHDRFVELTRRDDLDRVLDGIEAAKEAGLDPVKLNMVVMVGINDDEVLDFATFGRENDVIVRFIEFMPLDASGEWTAERVMAHHDIVEAIQARYPIEPMTRGSSPAERFRYLDGRGELGVIASVTEPFCESCDRIRLTADGQIRNCLFALAEYNLRDPLRAGASDAELGAIVAEAVGAKWAGHAIGQVHFIRPKRSMSQIGG